MIRLLVAYGARLHRTNPDEMGIVSRMTPPGSVDYTCSTVENILCLLMGAGADPNHRRPDGTYDWEHVDDMAYRIFLTPCFNIGHFDVSLPHHVRRIALAIDYYIPYDMRRAKELYTRYCSIPVHRDVMDFVTHSGYLKWCKNAMIEYQRSKLEGVLVQETSIPKSIAKYITRMMNIKI